MVGNLLLRGMIAGLVAGLLVFGFARGFGEPLVDQAIAYEEQMAKAAGDVASEPEIVSRATQAGLGLFTGVVIYGAAVGGLFSLVFAFVLGRYSMLGIRATAAILAAVCFISITFVPALKYPATPPAVGNPDTISARTELFFLMIIVSIAALMIAFVLARRLAFRFGVWNGAIAAGIVYVVFMGLVQWLLPVINEVPENYSAVVLWRFRIVSLGMHALLWTVLGLVFGALAERYYGARQNQSLTGI